MNTSDPNNSQNQLSPAQPQQPTKHQTNDQQVQSWTSQTLKPDAKPADISQPPAKPKPGRPRQPTKQYTVSRAAKVLHLIQTTTLTIDQIATNIGIGHQQVYTWLSSYNEFAEDFSIALQTRAHVYQDSIQKALDSLDIHIEDEYMDVREKHVRVNATNIKIKHLQWLCERLNRRVYGQMPQTIILGGDPVQLREQAWSQRVRDTRAEDVTPAGPKPEQS